MSASLAVAPAAAGVRLARVELAAAFRAATRQTAAQFRSAGGQPELFAAVRRELDRVNPGYDR